VGEQRGADVKARVSTQPGMRAVGAVTHTTHPGCPWTLASHCYNTVGPLIGLVAPAEGWLGQQLAEVGGDARVTHGEPPPKYFPGVHDCHWKHPAMLPFLPCSPRS